MVGGSLAPSAISEREEHLNGDFLDYSKSPLMWLRNSKAKAKMRSDGKVGLITLLCA